MVTLRPVKEEDVRLLWEWVNDQTVRVSALHPDPIPWESHVAWFRNKRTDRNCHMYLVIRPDDQPIGQIRFDVDPDGSTAEVDLSIASGARGHGYGPEALRLATSQLFSITGVQRVVARVKRNNLASLRVFEKAGFTQEARAVDQAEEIIRFVMGPLMNREIAVLITGAGGAGTIEVIRSLKGLGRYRIIAVDASPYAAGFSFADRSTIVPFATDPTFPNVFERLLTEERPAFIVPLVDEEIPIIHRLVAGLPSPRPRLVAPSLAFCLMALDKWQTFQALRRHGISTPRTSLASDVGDGTFPAVVKPRDGRGSRELAYVRDSTELRAYLTRVQRPASAYIVQRQVIGREYTVSNVVGLGGPMLAIVPKEVVYKRGITQIGVTRCIGEIERLCREIHDRLRPEGPFNVQLIIDRDGIPSVIEINPRYSTTVALTIAAGLHEVDLVIRHALGEPIGPITFQPNLMMIRYTTQLYRPEAEWPPASGVDDSTALQPRVVAERTLR